MGTTIRLVCGDGTVHPYAPNAQTIASDANHSGRYISFCLPLPYLPTHKAAQLGASPHS